MKFETLATHCLAHGQGLLAIGSEIYWIMVISSLWKKTCCNMTEFVFFMTCTLEVNFPHILRNCQHLSYNCSCMYSVNEWFVVHLHGCESRKQELLLWQCLFTQLFLKPKIRILWCVFGFIYILMDINTLQNNSSQQRTEFNIPIRQNQSFFSYASIQYFQVERIPLTVCHFIELLSPAKGIFGEALSFSLY